MYGDEKIKIKIEIEDNLTENEIVIHCNQIDENIKQIQEAIVSISRTQEKFILFKEETEYYVSLNKILFFETQENVVYAHTRKDVYQTKLRLYELENLLPDNFMRISKSAILNLNHVFSITRNITASSEVQFEGTHKQIYISRNYYKSMKSRLDEKRSF